LQICYLSFHDTLRDGNAMCRRIFFDTMVPVRKIYSRCVRHWNCVRHSPNFAYALVEILHASLRPRFPRSQSPPFCRWLLCGNGSSIWRSPVAIHSALPLYRLGGANGAFGAPLNRSRGSEHSAHSAAAAGRLPAIQVPRSARARRVSALLRASALAAERPNLL